MGGKESQSSPHRLLLSSNLNFSSLLSLAHITERDLQQTSRGMGCSAGRNAGLDPSSPDAISLVADRTGFIGPSAGGLDAIGEVPAAGCARTLTGEPSRGLEVVGWRWDMNPSTMMKFRAAALPLGYDTSRTGGDGQRQGVHSMLPNE